MCALEICEKFVYKHSETIESATFLLVCFACLKEGIWKEKWKTSQGKMFFISLQKLFSFLR